ncbi:MAG: ribonuclease R [Gammaproteobacteria bacterium]|nr:ribonuclease R [Gammaproteobacteria bacterium]MDH5777151.1 ribonuclease R [Gammaproteobacteria bacterium]
MTKPINENDPHALREAEKYDNPIPSREFIMDLLDKQGTLNREQIAAALNLNSEEQLEALRRRMRAMERDGQVIYTRKGGYGLICKMDLIKGRVQGHPDGFGFLIPDEGGDDLFLSAREMKSLMNGDRAMVHVKGIDRRGRREGGVIEVLERNNHRIVGRLFVEGGVCLVAPDNKRLTQDILVPKENLSGATHGQIVSVEIVEQPSKYRQAIGKVVETLGEHMAPGMEIDIAIRSYDIPDVWSPEAEQEATRFTEEVPEEAKQGREDIRDLPLVTIDGEDARDFDDAVYCEKQGSGWRLLVAIADVSAYVKPGMALDKDAAERGTSTYFPERVIPMLPEVLSNGLCSINPDVDRLCMVCELNLNANGAVKNYRFFEGVMKSHARLTYTKVAAMLVDGDEELRAQYAAQVPYLENLHELYKVLLNSRQQRGAIDFETTETRIVFGADRKIDSIVPVVRNDAHKLIEECMLLANTAAADFLEEHKLPALFRVHEGPNEEKISVLREFLSELGLDLGGGDSPEPKHYAKLLNSIKGRHDAHLIQTVMLRSLKQAVYTPDNAGHFGLAFDAYAHFTSPIRRYPDLLVHRAIRHVLQGGTAANFYCQHDQMAQHGEHCSMTERRSDEATRDATDWLKCEFMLDKVGDEFDGVISSVTSFGLFVELNNIYVEGLVHVTSLGKDYFHFDPVHHRMIGEHTRHIYRLGNRIRVIVARVDLDERKIDFELADEQPENTTSRKELNSADKAVKKAKKQSKKDGKKRPDEGKKSSAKKGRKNSSKKKTSGKKRATNKKKKKKKS